MYSLGAAERRLGELARGKDVIIATKYPSSFSFRAEDFPKELEKTLARLRRRLGRFVPASLPQCTYLHFSLDESIADAVEVGKVRR